MNRIGPRTTFNSGILITSISCVAFGFLDNVIDHTAFITLSFLFRTLEALGASALVTASFTIIACEFPDSVATTFASLETFFGLGLILGPSVGGALFELGGFFLPFAFTGVGLFLISIGAFIVMPKIETLEDGEGRSTKGFGIFSILRIPGVAVGTVALVMITNSVGFLSATLEPHLRQVIKVKRGQEDF
jgi:MFS family permease